MKNSAPRASVGSLPAGRESGPRAGRQLVSLLLLAGVLALAWGAAGHWHGGQGDLENARVCAVCHAAHNPTAPGVAALTVPAPPVLLATEAERGSRQPPSLPSRFTKHPRAPPA